MKIANVEKKIFDKLETLAEHENKYENESKSSCTLYMVYFQ